MKPNPVLVFTYLFIIVYGVATAKSELNCKNFTAPEITNDYTNFRLPAETHVYYYDNDHDGYGDPLNFVSDTIAPNGYISDNTDCNDNNAAVHPSASEICNHIDDNCDGQTDEGVQTVFYADNDLDGFGNADQSVSDCSAPSGYVSNNNDCNDNDVNVHPGVSETCNHVDDNCDGQTDEGVQSVFYADADQDGYGNPSSSVMDCSAPSGYVLNNTDCDDSHAEAHPGGTEVCNGLDDDCSGTIDDNIVSQVNITWQKTFGGTDIDQAEAIESTLDGGYIIAGKTLSSNGNITQSHGRTDMWIVKIDASGNILWQKTYGGANDDNATAIRPLSNGSYIIVGATASFNGDVSGNHGLSDFWVIKIDGSGNLIWQKCYGGSGDDMAYSVTPADGGYVVVGYTKSSDGNLTAGHSSGDYWIIKIDTVGNLLWQKSYGGSGYDFAYNVVQASDGGYITSGYARSNDGDVIGNHGQEDVWILKLDSAGNLLWQKSYGGTGGEGPNSMQATTDGGYILAGVTHSYNIDVVGNHGVHDYWVLKTDHSGNIQWKECLGGSETDNGNAVRQTSDGGYIVAGLSDSNDGDVTGNHGKHDYWVVKLNSNGSIEWQKSLGGTQDDEPYGIVQSSDGQYVIAGFANSKDGDITSYHGNSDFWIVKIQTPSIKTFYLDNDGDAYGNPNIYITACSAPAGYVDNSSDCNDNNPNVNPSATDICNGIDDNCNSYTDENAVVASITPLETITICNTSSLALFANTGSNYSYQWQKNNVNINGATNSNYSAQAAGTYRVVINDGTCSSNSPGTVIKVTTKYTAIKPAGTTSICDGLSVSYSVKANPGIAFQWKNDEGNIPGATNPKYVAKTSGNYYVTLKDVTGCTFNSTSGSLQVNPSPSADVTVSGSLNICSTGSVTFTVSSTPGATYKWYKDNVAIAGATSTSYTATIAGNYKVIATAAGGCSRTSTSKSVKGCKMDDNEANSDHSEAVCYPNPSNGDFMLKLDLQNSFSGKATLEICNLLGQVIFLKNEAINDGILYEKISLHDHLMSGAYLLKLRVNEQEYQNSIIISQ